MAFPVDAWVDMRPSLHGDGWSPSASGFGGQFHTPWHQSSDQQGCTRCECKRSLMIGQCKFRWHCYVLPFSLGSVCCQHLPVTVRYCTLPFHMDQEINLFHLMPPIQNEAVMMPAGGVGRILLGGAYLPCEPHPLGSVAAPANRWLAASPPMTHILTRLSGSTGC